MSMSSHTQLVRWGNSMAVRLSKGVIEKARFTEGEDLSIEAAAGRVTIRRAEREPTLEELVARITPENRHGEISCGPAVGREVLEEW